jgi:toxin ParE1/3/4
MQSLIITPQADRDIDEIFDYLRGIDPALAGRFFHECQAAIALVAKFPLAGGRLLLEGREDLDYRYVYPKGFDRYLIFYRLDAIRIEIVRVLHSSRDLSAALDPM